MHFRKLVNTLHLWFGLASGLVLFAVCLSGTVYTFRAEIEHWLQPGKYYANHPGGAPWSAARLVKAVEAQTQGKVTNITIAADADWNWQFAVRKTDSVATSKEAKPKTVFVDPYTGRIAGEQGGSVSEFFTKVMRLHRWLLMDDSLGRPIVGVATIIFFFMILSGLVLWLPAKLRHWKQGLKIRTSGNWKRTNHDLHNTFGFYAAFFLLIMCLTGLCWSFEWYRDGMSSTLGAKVFKGRGEKPVTAPTANASAQASVDDYIAAAQRLFPYRGNLRLSLPEKEGLAIIATKNASGFFAVAGADKVQLSPSTAEVLTLERFSDKPLNVQIADSIRPLHTGEMFGTFSKIIYFLACLIATSLPVTGTLIWLNKKKKKSVILRPGRVREFA